MAVHNENTIRHIRAENYFIRRSVYIGNKDRRCVNCYIEEYWLNNNLLGTGKTVETREAI